MLSCSPINDIRIFHIVEPFDESGGASNVVVIVNHNLAEGQLRISSLIAVNVP